MIISKSTEAIALSEAPTKSDRVLADRKAQIIRATTPANVQEIPCPGGCGALASLESPMMVTRNGETRRIQVAQCQGECRRESRSASGKARLVPARFDIVLETKEAPLEASQATTTDELPTLLSLALKATGYRQEQAAAEIGLSQSAISKMLHGRPVATRTANAATNWARSVLDNTLRSDSYSAPEDNTSHDKTPRADCQPEIFLREPYDRPDVTQNECSSKPETASEGALDSWNEATESAINLEKFLNPYEAVLRNLLEGVAQRHLEQIAGPAAEGVTVRVVLEWKRVARAERSVGNPDF